MSEVKFKRYCRVSDFQRVYELCERLGDLYHSNGTDASFWEYAQTFGSFKDEYSHRIGLWEDDGKLIALATYEIDLGEAYFMLDPNYSYLSHSLIQYAEKYLTDNNSLTLNLSNAQTALRESALKQGYSIKNKYPKKIYRFENGLLNTFFQMEMWILEYICTQHLILTQLYRLLLLIKRVEIILAMPMLLLKKVESLPI